MSKDGRSEIILPLTDLTIDHTQVRQEVNMNIVRRYSERADAGDRFPPVEVTFDEATVTYYLTDGFHRYWSARQLGKAKIRCMVKPGDKRDAVVEAAKANHTHGEPLKMRDKRRAISMLIYHLPDAKPEQIAEWTKSSVQHIRDVMHELSSGESVKLKKIREKKKKMVKEEKEEKDLTPVEVLSRRKSEAEDILNPLLVKLNALAKAMQSVMGKPVSAFLHEKEIDDVLKATRQTITRAMPYKICPYCGGKRCDGCRKQGWVTRPIWHRAPKELITKIREEKMETTNDSDHTVRDEAPESGQGEGIERPAGSA
jgi:ParB-like chromosome segregation protein Spo0J